MLRAPSTFSGIGVSHGIAIGDAYVVQVDQPHVEKRGLEPGETEGEVARFDAAVVRAREDIEALRRRMDSQPAAQGDVEGQACEEITLLLDAHLAMLSGSRLIRGVQARIRRDQVNAEAAVTAEVAALAQQFRALDDQYIAARIDDVAAVGQRLVRILLNLPYMSLSSVPPGGIVIAKELSPADIAQIDPRHFGGIVTVHGGAAGHTAVVARSLGLPAVLGVPARLLEKAAGGCRAIVDGISGQVILCPDAETEQVYAARLAALESENSDLSATAGLPAVTTDGAAITLRANLELPREIDAIRACGADGIGLFRTEFMFMNRDSLPGENEQFEAMAEIVQRMEGRSVTFRTLDIGGDKLIRALGPAIAEAANPALGLRAIRLSLREPALLKTQMRAICRAGYFGPVRILLPMVTLADEVERARRILRDSWKELQAEGMALAAEMPPLGTMIEIPAAALSADSLAAVSDFFALGTNDLVQYTVAIDRGNDQVAALYNPLHPAVLRLMKFAVEAGTRAGLSVSICGEMGADPRYTALLIGMGIREISVGHAGVARVKRRIRGLSLAAAETHARQVLDQYDPAAIESLVAQFNN